MKRRAYSLLAMLLSLALVGCESGAGNVLNTMTMAMTGTNPSDVQGATVEIEEAEEIELGRAVTATLGSRYKLLRDDPLTRYVALVGNAVALQSDRPDIRYYFGVLDTPELNAFAAPGGYIFITRGTLGLIRDEATLAGVLGHEIGHVALRHHVKTIKAEKQAAVGKGVGVTAARIGLGFIPGVGGAVASGVASSPLLNVMADGAVNLTLKGFSRDEEREADGVGFKYAARAGYDPAGLRDFLKTLSETGQTQASSFLSTHPGSAERLRDQDAALKASPATGRRNAERFTANVNPKAPAR